VAAEHLVRRALALVPDDEVDVPLELDLADAIFFSGRPDEGYRTASDAAERAARAGDRIGELSGRLQSGIFNLYIGPDGALAKLESVIAEALPELEAAEDDFALHVVHFARAQVARTLDHNDEEIAATERAMFHSQRTGLPHLVAWLIPAGGAAHFYGSTPVEDLLEWIETRAAEFGPSWRLRHWRADALALLGNFDESRALQTEYREMLEERGNRLALGSHLSQNFAAAELFAGNPAAAAERGGRLPDPRGSRRARVPLDRSVLVRTGALRAWPPRRGRGMGA
jgi:hypothetical protein